MKRLILITVAEIAFSHSLAYPQAGHGACGRLSSLHKEASRATVIATIRRFGEAAITVSALLAHAHSAGAQVSGSGVTLAAALSREHHWISQVTDNVPTPGAPSLSTKIISVSVPVLLLH